MNKKTLRDVDLKGKRVVMRVDFNVPIKEGKITDDTRIKGALPSINYVLEKGDSLVLMSHLGRPKGKGYEANFSLKPVAEYLAKMLGKPVTFAADCANADADVAALQARRHRDQREHPLLQGRRGQGQEDRQGMSEQGVQGQEGGAQGEAEGAGQARLLRRRLLQRHLRFRPPRPRVHGRGLQVHEGERGRLPDGEGDRVPGHGGREADPPVRRDPGRRQGLGQARGREQPARQDRHADHRRRHGLPFLKAMGHDVGNSLCELDQLEYAEQMIAKAKANGKTLLLPVDNVAADKFDAEANTQVVDSDIPAGWMALDIGPKTWSCTRRPSRRRRWCGTGPWAASR